MRSLTHGCVICIRKCIISHACVINTCESDTRLPFSSVVCSKKIGYKKQRKSVFQLEKIKNYFQKMASLSFETPLFQIRVRHPTAIQLFLCSTKNTTQKSCRLLCTDTNISIRLQIIKNWFSKHGKPLIGNYTFFKALLFFLTNILWSV